MPKHYSVEDASKLTSSAIELLAYIYEELKEWNGSPTHAQMAAALGLRSRSYVNRLLSQLKKGGFVLESENKRVKVARDKVEELLKDNGYDV